MNADTDADTAIDPITARVIQGRLDQIALEMSRKLIRMGFSPVIKEMEDIGCALCDADGWQFAEADNTPLQLGPAPYIIQGILQLAREQGRPPRPGDVFVHNDPYLGASHSPDVAIVVPVFDGELLMAWTCAAAHHIDIGASKPGTSVPDAVDAWADGIRLRGLRLRSAGEDNLELWRMLEDNVRLPRLFIGDLKAQLAAAELGARRFRELVADLGYARIKAAQAWYEDYAERRLRAEIEAIPDGEYHAERDIDGFVNSPDPRHRNLHLAVTLRVKGDALEVDLTGCADQLDDLAINMPLQGTVTCSVLTAVRSILLDEAVSHRIPQNRGLVRPVTIIAPPGSIVNPNFPAPSLCRVMPAIHLTDTVVRAFAEVVPEKCCAGCGSCSVFTFSGFRDGELWAHFEIHEGAYGARAGKDGLDAADTLMTNTRCAPIEEVESTVPIRCERWELNDEPLGHGRFRGGRGGTRQYRYLADTHLACEAEGCEFSPWGMHGGAEGTPLRIRHVDAAGLATALPSKIAMRAARAGDALVIIGANGGGYGNPLDRDPQAVLEDWLDDLVSDAEVEAVYGVRINRPTRQIDAQATATLRQGLREAQGR